MAASFILSQAQLKSFVDKMSSDLDLGSLIITTATAGSSAISAISGAPACVITCVGHGLVTGNIIKISGITQTNWSGLNNINFGITKINDDTFSIPYNTTSWTPAYSDANGVFAKATTLATLTLPADATNDKQYGGVLIFSTVNPNVATASGTAALFGLWTSAGDCRAIGNVGISATALLLGSTTINAGDTISPSQLRITFPAGT